MKLVNVILIFSLFGLVACNKDAGSLIPSFSTTVEFANTSMSFSEDNDTIRIPIIVSSLIDNDIEVEVTVINQGAIEQGAIEGEHFSLLSKYVTIPARENSSQLLVLIHNDTIINQNRKFSLQISGIKGAEPDQISQSTQIIIQNDDRLPEIQFIKSNHSILEREKGVWIPYEVTGQLSETTGQFYQPMKVRLKFADVTPDAINYYELPSNIERVFNAPIKDSIFIKRDIDRQELLNDVRFKMEWNIVDSTGIIAKNKETLVMIGDVKVVEFAETDLMLLTPNGPTEGGRVEIPVKFSYVPSGGISAIINVNGVDGYGWEKQELTADRDTILYAILNINKDAVMSETIDFTMKTPPGFDGYDVDKDAVASVKAVRDFKKDSWLISANTKYFHEDNDAEKLIDGSEETFWRGTDLPPAGTLHEIVIDMGSNIEIRDIALLDWPRSATGTGASAITLAEEVEVKVSSDQVNWNSHVYKYIFGTTPYNGTQKMRKAYSKETVIGRYLKVTVTKGNTSNRKGALSEIYVAGLMRR